MEILLVRHGESLGNLEPGHYLEVADHSISLSPAGFDQADASGAFIAKWVESHWFGQHVRMWNSPYRRTRQIAARIEGALGDLLTDRREHILLAEQQFGLFDGLTDEEAAERYPDEWAHYARCERFDGRFWARLPLGESRFDVAQRVHQALGTFHRDATRHGVERLIVVCHGTTARAFIMMWLHHPFEWFESEPNPKNCSVRLIDDDVDHGYLWPPKTRLAT